MPEAPVTSNLLLNFRDLLNLYFQLARDMGMSTQSVCDHIRAFISKGPLMVRVLDARLPDRDTFMKMWAWVGAFLDPHNYVGYDVEYRIKWLKEVAAGKHAHFIDTVAAQALAPILGG